MKKVINGLLIVLLVVTVALVAYAVAASPENKNAAINLNLIWGYILLGAAVLSALGCAVWGLLKNPAGLKSTVLSLVLIAAVIIVSYVIAAGNDVKIVDLQTGGYFEHWKTVIAECGIWVAYITGAGAILSAVYAEIANAFK